MILSEMSASLKSEMIKVFVHLTVIEMHQVHNNVSNRLRLLFGDLNANFGCKLTMMKKKKGEQIKLYRKSELEDQVYILAC